MQPVGEELRVARRTLDLEDYIDVARRHKAWVLGPTFLGVVVAVVVAFLWPNTYVSKAIVRVVPPQVPERFVPTNINIAIDQRINMAQSILSRATLTNIIQTYGLYPSQRKRSPMEDVIEDMRKDVNVGSVFNVQRGKSMSAFEVSFAYQNRFLAQKVCADLVARFIDENIRARSQQSVSTTGFLKDQWEQAKKELDAAEQKLSVFRARFNGRLPDQLESSMQRLNAFDSQINSLNSSVNRALQEKMLLDTKLNTLKTQLSQGGSGITEEIPTVVVTKEVSQRLTELDHQITNLELGLTALREKWTDQHPAVVTQRSRINTLRESRAKLAAEEDERYKERLKKAGAIGPIRRVDANRQREIRDTQGQIDATLAQLQVKDMEIENLQKEQARIDKIAKDYRAQLQASPANEGEYSVLLQDRELARKRYDDQNLKLSQSEVATDLENRKQGETLELLDPPSTPQTPTAPKRWLIIGVGVALGLGIGLTLAGVWEVKDTSLKNLKDVRAYTHLMVLTSIPLLENDFIVRRRRRLAWLGWSTACLIGVAIMGASVFYYLSTST
jgi:polysaccharide chain length determinant protein (PEP-CTERM system associated)